MTTELTKAAQQALEACPFCGCEPQDAHHIEYGRWAVTCRCGAKGASANTGPNATDAAKIKAYSDARTAWNTRALTQRPAAQTEREAFEAWAASLGYNAERDMFQRDMYQSTLTWELWRVWQARASLPAPQPDEDDDGDVTGQPGPLPETGWDEVPAGAFRKPSPTAGMNLGERIKHVGGRENAAGYIEFGSVAAVRALVRQYLRDLPAPQQATPEPLTLGPLAKRNIYDAIRGAYDLGYNDARNARTVPGDSAPGYDGRSVEEDHGGALFNLLSKRLTPATPEPVGEPYGWAVTGCHSLYRGEWAEATARGEAKRCGGTARAVALYARRGAGVPEGWRNVIAGTLKTDPWDSARVADYNSGWNDCQRKTLRGLERLAAAQAKGGE